jgi:hypothetical protein
MLSQCGVDGFDLPAALLGQSCPLLFLSALICFTELIEYLPNIK